MSIIHNSQNNQTQSYPQVDHEVALLLARQWCQGALCQAYANLAACYLDKCQQAEFYQQQEMKAHKDCDEITAKYNRLRELAKKLWDDEGALNDKDRQALRDFSR